MAGTSPALTVLGQPMNDAYASPLRVIQSYLSLKFASSNSSSFRLRAVVLRGRSIPTPTEAELKRTFLKFLSDESGATAIEYGLIAAGIALAIIAVVNGLGTNLNDKFTSINTSLK